MERYWLVAAAFCFLLSFGRTLYALGAGRFRPGRFNLATMSVGFAFMSVFLYFRGQLVGACPITNLFEVLVFLGWSIVLLYLVVGPAYRLSLMGAFTAPLVLSLLLLALIAPVDSPTLAARANPWVEFHGALSIIAYGAFALAGIAGIMYLVQENQLKSRKGTELLYNLPPIADLGTANARLVFAGFLMLSIALLAGFFAGLPVAGFKTWTSIGIWLCYGILALARRRGWWPPRRFAQASVAVFVMVLVTLPGIQYLSSAP